MELTRTHWGVRPNVVGSLFFLFKQFLLLHRGKATFVGFHGIHTRWVSITGCNQLTITDTAFVNLQWICMGAKKSSFSNKTIILLFFFTF